ncbi:MAG: hypothetical protein FJ265_01780 [Planctomycetes bacterium]|nr:hypothetical protein [Planctomycetota bacterium]
MDSCRAAPWFHAALELLDLRRQDRVLAFHAGPAAVRSLAALVGGAGVVTVVQPDPAAAGAVQALGLPMVEVAAMEARGDERFGTFDAMLVAPRWLPAWPLGAYAGLPRINLRPGGRLVVDVPAPDAVPQLTAACRDLGWPETRLQPLRGQRDDDLTGALRDAGLRHVRATLAAHLLHLDSPFDATDQLGAPLDVGEQERQELGRALVQRLGTTGGADVLVHRTRVQALR